MANEIFSLMKSTDSNDDFHTMLAGKGAWPRPPELDRIAEIGATMQTKLWINREENRLELDDLDYLVICGQATTCYNLLKYMWEQLRVDNGAWNDASGWIDPKMCDVFRRTLNEWKKFTSLKAVENKALFFVEPDRPYIEGICPQLITSDYILLG